MRIRIQMEDIDYRRIECLQNDTDQDHDVLARLVGYSIVALNADVCTTDYVAANVARIVLECNPERHDDDEIDDARAKFLNAARELMDAWDRTWEKNKR